MLWVRLSSMKIYLDIDETLINNNIYEMNGQYIFPKPKPANHLKEFLEHMLKNYDVYWLTTHCNGDASTAVSYMAKSVPDEIVGLIKKIKPTKWNLVKSEAIDMNEDFLWFDDAPTWEDTENLKKHNKLESLVRVNLDENPDILSEFIDQPPICRGYIVDLFKKSYMLHIWTKPKISFGWHRKTDGPNKKIFGIKRY